MAVAASSHHRGPGSITQKSQVGAAKQIPIRRCVTVFWEAMRVMRDCVLFLVKRQWGQTQSVCSLSIGGLGVLRASDWVPMVWSKVS